MPEANSASTTALVEGSARGPATQAERIVPLDALRGLALLGILVMNIQSFAMIDSASFNPTAFGDLTGANYWVWYLSHLLADQKMMTIFSMLFGAGIVLITRRNESATGRSAGLHYRRMGILFVLGLLHGYLLWFGDILHAYALCGLVVYLFRNFRPWSLLVLGFLLLLIGSTLSLLIGRGMQLLPPEELSEFSRDFWKPPPKVIAEELAAYRGDWLTEIVHRAPTTFEIQTGVFATFIGWRAGGLMLVGMALFKLGVFDATRSPRTYGAMIAVAVLVGIPTIMFGVRRNVESGWTAEYSFFAGSQHNYWASILVSGGWIGIVMLACQNERCVPVTRRLAAVGQMALTNYLLHSLICTTIFYGRGFGLYGQVERVGQIGIVFLIWTFQLIVSPLWLQHFRFGPAEWLWRSLTYSECQPLRMTSR